MKKAKITHCERCNTFHINPSKTDVSPEFVVSDEKYLIDISIENDEQKEHICSVCLKSDKLKNVS